MDNITIRYSVAAAVILVTVTVGVSAFAESGQYQPPIHPVDSNDRLPGVIQVEQFLNRNGVTGLNNVKSRPAAAAPSRPEPVAQPVELQPEPVVPSAPPASDQPAPAPRRDATAPVSAQVPVSSSAFQAPITEDAHADAVVPMVAPGQDAAILYAPPMRPPWWERLLSSRGFLYAAAFCMIAVPAGTFAASAVMGRRREERDLALYD